MTDSSLRFDKTIKKDLYAQTGVPEYWISDIEHGCIIAHANLQEGRYSDIRQYARGMQLAPRLLPECEILVDALLP